MPRLFVLLLACALGACVAPDPNRLVDPSDPTRPVAVPNEKAAVVIGVSVRNPNQPEGNLLPAETDLGWIEIDPVTGQRRGVAAPVAHLDCSVTTNCDADTGKTVQYQVYLLEPGTYALGWVANGVTLAEPSTFTGLSIRLTDFLVPSTYGSKRISISLDARAHASTPVFKIGAGEVIYPGDLIFDFADNARLGWSVAQNDAAARRYLSATGLANRMIDRPMLRADGSPVRAADGALILGRVPGRITFAPTSSAGGYR